MKIKKSRFSWVQGKNPFQRGQLYPIRIATNIAIKITLYKYFKHPSYGIFSCQGLLALVFRQKTSAPFLQGNNLAGSLFHTIFFMISIDFF
jgi:hypothetical protein